MPALASALAGFQEHRSDAVAIHAEILVAALRDHHLVTGVEQEMQAGGILGEPAPRPW